MIVMIATAYDIEINDDAIVGNLTRIGNQIFKLLPMREEGKDWVKPLETLTLELAGMSALFDNQKTYLSLLCKMEGLKTCTDDKDFLLYRRTVFECCGLVDEVRSQCR